MELSRNQDEYTIKLTRIEAVQLRVALNAAAYVREPDRPLQPAATELRNLLEGATR